MNEEEKKAVEIFEFCSKYNCVLGEKRTETILNLIVKLQKENEELKIKNNAIKRESEAYAENMIRLDNKLNLEKKKSKYEWIRQNCLPQKLVNKLYIPKQIVKDNLIKYQEEYKLLLEHQSGKESNRTKYLRGRIHMCQELLESEEKE